MGISSRELTPRQIVAELDRYIVGQDKAKRSVAIALRNRIRRQSLSPEVRDEIIPKNILMIGPTGVGKTEIARRLAQLARAPFIKVEATKFTEVGYVGRDVDSMVRDLTSASVRMVEREKMEGLRERAEEIAVERIVELLAQSKRTRKRRGPTRLEEQLQRAFEGSDVGAVFDPFADEDESVEPVETSTRRRTQLRREVLSGTRDDEIVVIEIEESAVPFVQVFSPQGMEEMGVDIGAPFGAGPKHRVERKMRVGDACRLLAEEEARKLIDNSQVTREAIERVEQSGIIFLDELDKIAGRETGGSGPDVSREGVQRDLLPIIEGSSVVTKYGTVRTDHILFIAAGAFHVTKPSDLIPELQGRLPIRVELENLTQDDFVRILTEPQNALITQYVQLLSTEGVSLRVTADAVQAIAAVGADVNARTENIGARRLHTIMERVLEDVLFAAPELDETSITVDAAYVYSRLEGIVKDLDISRYIL